MDYDKLMTILQRLDMDMSFELGSVLSALRGPDDNDDDLKARTTARIRAKALPHASLRGTAWMTYSGDVELHADEVSVDSHWTSPSLYSLNAIPGHNEHFISHVLDAAHSLRMDVHIADVGTFKSDYDGSYWEKV